MEIKNKDGKTFGDIFSKVNDENISFNNIKDEVSEGNGVEEKDTLLDNKKTFNSIFDSDNSISSKSNSIFDKAVEDSSNEEVEKSTESFSDIFDKREENINEINDKEKESSVFDKVVEDNDEKAEKSTESFSDIFDKKEENINEINDKEKESSVFDKVVEANEEKVEKPTESFSDIFDRKEDVSNNIDDKDKEKVNNVFFDIGKDDADKKESANIFFNNGEDKVKESDKDQDEKKMDTEDVSPFFQDVNNTEEVNPFFGNKINLIEKPEYSSKDISGKIDVSNVQNFDVKIRKKRPNLVQAILGVLSYALFIWLLLIGIALLVYVLDIKIRAAKGDTSPPKYGAYVVLTGSMLPEIQVYDVVVTKKQDADDLKEGDVITFASSDSRFAGTIITHRIIKKNYNSKTKSYTFQTKGDNNNVADSALVSPENIYGRVILKIPKLGYLRDFLASDGGWILVILFPCLAVVAYDIVKISKGLKKKNYKNLKVQSR